MKYVHTTYLISYFFESFIYFPRKLFKGGNYSRAETIQGRKLLIVRRFLLRKLFKGGNYSRAETIRGNTVYEINGLPNKSCPQVTLEGLDIHSTLKFLIVCYISYAFLGFFSTYVLHALITKAGSN